MSFCCASLIAAQEGKKEKGAKPVKGKGLWLEECKGGKGATWKGSSAQQLDEVL